MTLPQPGTEAYRQAIYAIEAKLSRKLTNSELDSLRSAVVKCSKPRKTEGKTRTRSANMRSSRVLKRMRVSQLPADWQCN